MKCGLLGRKLGHSYSPAIHAMLGDYEYRLYEIEPESLEVFLRHGDWDGINVTMPYKQAVIPFLDDLTSTASQLGAVNTIIRRGDKLIGTNTDYWGFLSMLSKSKLSPAGKKCLVLGNGGASKVVQYVLQEKNANVVVISRGGENNYENICQHSDAAIIVNTTPVGMYPTTGFSPVDLEIFPNLEGVLDLVYNPARTKLLMDAQKRGIVAMNGLWMLISQAMYAIHFIAPNLPQKIHIGEAFPVMQAEMENIIFIGMPGSGKSTVGQLVAKKTGKVFVDTDTEIQKLAQKTIPKIFAEDGEVAFRDYETRILEKYGKQSGLVIATGGGCVTKERNYPLLHQNGTIFWLQRNIDQLPTEGRPLSENASLQKMYQIRQPLYHHFADVIIDNNDDISLTVSQIMDHLSGSHNTAAL